MYWSRATRWNDQTDNGPSCWSTKIKTMSILSGSYLPIAQPIRNASFQGQSSESSSAQLNINGILIPILCRLIRSPAPARLKRMVMTRAPLAGAA